MSKEVLIFDAIHNKSQAFFLFTNTSSKNVSAKSGFPIEENFDFTWKDGIMTYDEEQTGAGNGVIAELVYYFLQRIMGNDIISVKDFFSTKAFVPDLDKLNCTKKFNYKAYDRHKITILKNGKEVPIEEALLETKVISRGNNSYTLNIKYHYLHTISLKPKESATYSVSYIYLSIITPGNKMTNKEYEWNYILGTGNTWRGPIGEFYFITNVKSNFYPEDLNLKYLTSIKNFDLYHRSNYEPNDSDRFSISFWSTSGYREYSFDFILEQAFLTSPQTPAQDFVKLIDSSSFLNETTTVYDFEEEKSYKTNFKPISLFDGIRETAWCEGKKDYGIGEWVSFEITTPVEGLDIYNGFARLHLSAPDEFGYYDEKLMAKMSRYTKLYEENTRVKTLSIISLDSSYKKTIALEDSRWLQSFPDIALSPGKYKIQIDSVYPGTKYKDTCLSEIIFYPSLYKKYFKKDTFLKSSWNEFKNSQK